MPNPKHTPLRNIRIDDDLWQKAKARAAENGETLTDAIKRFLTEYVTPRQDRLHNS